MSSYLIQLDYNIWQQYSTTEAFEKVMSQNPALMLRPVDDCSIEDIVKCIMRIDK